MTTYTLIAYRANGVHTCRGCVTDRCDSEFIHEAGLTRAELIERIASLRVGDLEWGQFDEIVWFQGTVDSSYDDSISDEAFARMPAIRAALQDEVKREQERQAAASRRAIEADERAQLRRLQQKYGGS